MTESPTAPHLAGRILRLATPVILAMLTQTAVNVIDTILVGHLPKGVATPGQAALEISLMLLWLIGGFLGAIAVGTQALTARRYGERNLIDAGQVATNSVVMAAVLSVALALLAWPATPFLFRLVNDNPRVMATGVPYWHLRLIGMPTMVLTLATKSFFDGIGRTKVHLVASVVMNVVNLALAYGLVFGRLGMPRLEVYGAGIAAVISSYVGLAVMLGAMLRPAFRRRYLYVRASNLSKKTMGEIAKLSLPSGLATMVLMSGFGLFLKIVAQTDRLAGSGTANFTATAIMIRFLSLLFVAALAYGTACATLVSQSLGEGKPDLAERYGYEAVRIGVAAGCVLGLLTFAFPGPILRAFTQDPAVMAAARRPLAMMGFTEPVVVAALVFTQALYGAGNPRFVMIVEFVLHFCVLVPTAWTLGVHFGLGLRGVWTAAGLYMALLCTAVAWKFREGKWKEIRI